MGWTDAAISPSCQFSSTGLGLSSSFLNPSEGLCYHAGSGYSGAIYATFWKSILLWHSFHSQTVTLLCVMAHKERSSSCTGLGKERSSGIGEEDVEQQLMPMCIQIQAKWGFWCLAERRFQMLSWCISHGSAIHSGGSRCHPGWPWLCPSPCLPARAEELKETKWNSTSMICSWTFLPRLGARLC